jgi:predicted HicB family RNase H-like nuclease
MSALSVRLPASLHRVAREVAAEEGVSINQLITSALGEKSLR